MFALAILFAVSVPASPDTAMASVVRLVYEGCLCAIAVLLTAMLPSRDATRIVDLVVELDDQARSGTLRDALATPQRTRRGVRASGHALTRTCRGHLAYGRSRIAVHELSVTPAQNGGRDCGHVELVSQFRSLCEH